MYEIILFDLEGTLTGFGLAILFALEKMGIHESNIHGKYQ